MAQLLSHDFHVEFPDLAERVDSLSGTDPRFAHMYMMYGQLDSEIIDAEDGIKALDDFSLEDMKKRRLKLKDELYQMLRVAS
jgi:uncharacterized protein